MAKLFLKELIINHRQTGGIFVPLLFFIFFVFIFAFIFYPQVEHLHKVIWLGCIFSTILKVDSLLAIDEQDGTLAQYILHSPSLLGLVIIKIIAFWLVNISAIVLLAPFLAFIFAIELAKIFLLFISLLVGSLALASLAMLAAAFMLAIERATMLLSIIILPLCLPLIIFAIATIESGELHIFLLFCSVSLFLFGMGCIFSAILLRVRY